MANLLIYPIQSTPVSSSPSSSQSSSPSSSPSSSLFLDIDTLLLIAFKRSYNDFIKTNTINSVGFLKTSCSNNYPLIQHVELDYNSIIQLFTYYDNMNNLLHKRNFPITKLRDWRNFRDIQFDIIFRLSDLIDLFKSSIFKNNYLTSLFFIEHTPYFELYINDNINWKNIYKHNHHINNYNLIINNTDIDTNSIITNSHNFMYNNYCDIIKFCIDEYRSISTEIMNDLRQILNNTELSRIRFRPDIIYPLPYSHSRKFIYNFIAFIPYTKQTLRQKVEDLFFKNHEKYHKMFSRESLLHTYCKNIIQSEHSWQRRKYPIVGILCIIPHP